MNFNTNHTEMKVMGSDVVSLLRHLRVRSSVVVGHSMGTIIAAEVASQAPDMIIGVALIDGSRISKEDPTEAVAKSNERFEHMGFKRCIKAKFERMFLPSSDERVKKHIIDRACAQPEVNSIKIISSAVRWCAEDFECKYSQLRVPIQVLQSTNRAEGMERAPVTADSYIKWHHDLMACGVDAEFELVEDCGHFTMLDRPDVVNTTINRLLQRVDMSSANQ